MTRAVKRIAQGTDDGTIVDRGVRLETPEARTPRNVGWPASRAISKSDGTVFLAYLKCSRGLRWDGIVDSDDIWLLQCLFVDTARRGALVDVFENVGNIGWTIRREGVLEKRRIS